MKKRLLSLLLALLMLVSLVPTAALAAVGDGEVPVAAPAADEDTATPAEAPAPSEDDAPAELAAAGEDIPQYSNNIALNKKVYVSSDKFAGTSTGATKDKANDGTATGKIGGQGQWVPNDMKGNSAEKPAWIVFDLATAKDGTTVEFNPVHIESINIWYNGTNWAQNYKVQTAASYDDANRDATVWTDLVTVTRTGVNANVTNGSGQNIADTANDCDTITLTSAPALVANAQAQRYVRFYIEEMNSACPYNDMGMVEFQLLANPDELPATASSVLERLSLDLTRDGDDKVTGVALSGTVPQGYTATVAANLEQVVGPDGTIYTPLVDTQVELAIEVAKNDSSDRATTPYASVQTVTIKGAHTENEGNPKPAVIPEIMEWYSDTTNSITLDEHTYIRYADDRALSVAQELQADLKELAGVPGFSFTIEKSDQQDQGHIHLVLSDGDDVAGFDDETYKMEIGNKVVITAKHPTGLYWGTRTLLQMVKLYGASHIPQGTMKDYPEFKVRGYVMDVGRKPVSMDMLYNIAKNMAWYKLNDFHVHLNDNLIAIEKYGYTNAVHQDTTKTQEEKDRIYAEGNRAYAGFRLESSLKEEEGANPLASRDYHYTKAEFSQFITDSAKLGVTIVPEIDTPAHAKAITDAWPSLREPANFNRHALNDHFNLSGKFNESVDKTKEILDDYINDSNPTFTNGIFHMGADEYYPNSTLYRKFHKTILAYLKEKNFTVRTWGSLSTMSSSEPDAQYSKEETSGVQMNIWNTGWANPQAMYDLGFDLINTEDYKLYIVPNGNRGRGGYGDYLDLNVVYSRSPNQIGDTWFPAGASQILGSAYAMWGDSMLGRDSTGLDEVDVFDRFYDALPVAAVRQWGVGTELDRTLEEVRADAATLGTAPRTNPYRKVKEADAFTYTFADDSLTTHGSAQVNRGVLVLDGGEGYVETGVTDKLGWGSQLSFKVFKLQGGGEEQVIFEGDYLAEGSAFPYNEYAIKALPVANKTDKWKLGFSRELHDYEFDVELPVGQWVTLTLTNAQQSTKLSVDGGAPVAAVGKMVPKANSNTQFEAKTGITNSSFEFPVARIGSKTNALVGYVDNVTTKEVVEVPTFLTATAPSEANKGNDGPASNAVDGDRTTYWHSRYAGCPNGKGEETLTDATRYIQLDLLTPATVSGLKYLRRPNGGNGTVTAYDIRVSTDGQNFASVKTGSGWGTANDWDTATFTPQENVTSVRLYGTTTTGGFMSAAEIELVYGEGSITLTDANTTVTWGEVVWGEDAATAPVSVALNPSGYVLTEGTDYTVSYSGNDNTAGGQATVTVTGIGAYAGTVSKPFTVPAKPIPVDLSACTVELVGASSYTYTGSPITPKVTVTNGQETLLEDLDYTLSYQYNVNAGNENTQVTVNAVAGTTTGSNFAAFSITPVDFSSTATLTGIASSYGLRPGGVTPEPIVTWNGKTLVKNTDYTLSYENNEAVTAEDAPATVTVTGTGNFTGTVSATFAITAETPTITGDDVTLQGGDTFTYTGGPISPAVTVSISGYYLIPDRDYTVAYANNIDLGEATVTVTGKDNYTGTVTKTFTITQANLSEATVTLSKLSFDYTGQAITPVPEVKMGSRTLRARLDYTVSYDKNVDPGVATVTVTGIGNYTGAASRFFVINGTQGGNTGGNTGGSSSGSSSGGSSTTTSTSRQPDGANVTTRTDATGAKTSTATYSNGAKVTADIPVTGPVTAVVTVPASADKVTVTVPTRETPTLGHIAVILHDDGTEEIVKTALPNEAGLAVTLEEDAIVQVVDNTRTFADVPADSWAKDAITFVTSREIFNGTGNDTFSPASNMSRAMVCTVLANLAGQDTKGGATWYEKSLAWAKENGISDGTVPHAIITREQLAAMLYRYAGSPEAAAPLPDRFRDGGAVSDWASQAVAWAVENDLLRGRSNESGLDLAPKATATRAEVAAVLQRYVALLK